MSVCWVDLGVPDPGAAARFYGELFGWTVAEPDATGYRLAGLGGHLVAGLGPAEESGRPYWTVYARTTDLAATVAAAVRAGGTVTVPPAAVGGAGPADSVGGAGPADSVGSAAGVRGPCGTPLSLWQPGTFAGTWTSGRHGTLAGVRLRGSRAGTADGVGRDRTADGVGRDRTADGVGRTRTADGVGRTRTADFLRAVLGWRRRADGVFVHDGQVVATWDSGPPPGVTPWLVGFHADNVGATVTRAQSLGAEVLSADVPDHPVLTDPSGAVFALVPSR